jgi:hypothetical protein
MLQAFFKKSLIKQGMLQTLQALQAYAHVRMQILLLDIYTHMLCRARVLPCNACNVCNAFDYKRKLRNYGVTKCVTSVTWLGIWLRKALNNLLVK